MTALRGVPPGRAGRLRLRHRLDTASRGAELLEEKLRLLRAEHEALQRAEELTRREWHRELLAAETWLVRGLLLGGERSLESAAVAGPAQVTVEWTGSLGVRRPRSADCAPGVRSADEPAPGNTALAAAEAGYRAALRAAAEYAAVSSAARIVGAELLGTRHRVRALRRHWIPRLGEALAGTDLALEQSEHEDAVRRRWASRPPAEPGRPAGA